MKSFSRLLSAALVMTISLQSAWAGNRAGKLSLPGKFGVSGGFEMQVREPSMCDGGAQFDLRWNKRAGKVVIGAKFDGLPYELDLAYNFNPGTPWNSYPDAVEDGAWQIWFVGHYFTKTSTFWYDAATGELLYNEFDAPSDGAPAGSIPVELPVLQMICATDNFESHPGNSKARVRVKLDYDQMLDAQGTGGVYVGVVPRNIFGASDLTIYYTEGGLPTSEAMNMDDILDELETGLGGIVFATSLEPNPKPAFLRSRDNLMIGWGADYPDGLATNPAPMPGVCGTFQWETGFNP